MKCALNGREVEGKGREWIDGRGERGRNRYNVMDFRKE